MINPMDWNAVPDSNKLARLDLVEREFLEARKFTRDVMQQNGLVVHLANSSAEHPTAIPLKNRDFLSEGFNYVAIQYWNLDGSPRVHNVGGPDRPYCRWRKLNHVPRQYTNTKTNKLTESGKYTVLPNTVQIAYLCKTVDWMSVAKDISIPIVFVEGEFSAITCNGFAIANGWNVRFVATGGLWMLYHASKHKAKTKSSFIYPFDGKDFELNGRQVFLCYDVDKLEKPDQDFSETVKSACEKHTSQLLARGADAQVLRLAKAPGFTFGRKFAPDDYFNNRGHWEALLATAVVVVNDSLEKVQARFAIVKETGDLFDLETGIPTSPSRFTALVGLYQYSSEPNGFAKFVDHTNTSYVTTIGLYDSVPFGLFQTDSGGHREKGYNAWNGLALEPGPQIDYVTEEWVRLLKLLHDENWQFVEAYFAHMVQKPFELPAMGLLTLSTLKGIGKSAHISPLMRILGPYAHTCDDRFLSDKHDMSYYNAIIVNDDEASIRTPAAMNLLKIRVTSPKIDVRPLYTKKITVQNYARTILSSNNPKDFPALEPERRLLVSRPQTTLPLTELKGALNRRDPVTNATYFESLVNDDRWARSILSKLLELKYTEHFRPGIGAPMTEAALDLEEVNESQEATSVKALFELCEGIIAYTAEMRTGNHKIVLDKALEQYSRSKATKSVKLDKDGGGTIAKLVTVISSGTPFKTKLTVKPDRTTTEVDEDPDWLRAKLETTRRALAVVASGFR